jgi:pyridoxal phosphate enzyme (YggS family)
MSMIARYHTLIKEISDIKQNVILPSGVVSLLAASKTQSPETIEKLMDSGLRTFGENRVQEAEAKWPEIKKRHPDVELHLIGPLQTNKVKAALALFDVIQTVDREKLAVAIARELEMWRCGDVGKKENTKSPHPHIPISPYPKFYLQVNTGNEPQKAGVSPENVADLLALCRKLQLPVTGLMCIPPANQPPAPHFALLYEIAKRHGLPELSMGMSEDYQTAIRMGSTCVRIGTKLFGERIG